MGSVKLKGEFNLVWSDLRSDYVTAIAWSIDGILAAISAAGEVVLYDSKRSPSLEILQAATGVSLDCLGFSHDGQFLAVGGQDGGIKIWQMKPEVQLMAALDNAPAWVDHLAWSPTEPMLAYSLGKFVQVWQAGHVVATLHFDTSSVMSLAWQPNGQQLAVGGYQGIKLWTTADWDDDPWMVTIPSASVALGWSPDSRYLATGNLDRTATVLDAKDLAHPWVMSGFPGKIRSLAWSDLPTQRHQHWSTSLLAVSSIEGVVTWEKVSEQFSDGWKSTVLSHHQAVVQGIQFHPQSFLLASAAEDGAVCLWDKAKKLTQILEGHSGWSSVAWHPQGDYLAAGGQQGELWVWAKEKRGQGFGARG
ncbi:MAG: hypothetical protein MUF49_27455 [Oculatellaceae cyanobacterium Prado106]|nr:hypothetical protein [Oculatellaceae cyanobacterium Prado106]